MTAYHPTVRIIIEDSPRHWAQPDLRGDVTNPPDFHVDRSAYQQGRPLELETCRFEVLNPDLDGLDWLRHGSDISLLIVSTRFLDVAQDAFGHALKTYPVVLEQRGQPFRSRTRYVLLQLGAPQPFFDPEGSDSVMDLDFEGHEVISYVRTYAFNLPEQVPPLFRLDTTPFFPTFATEDFLERARRAGLTNIAWMAAGSSSLTNQSQPL